MDELHLQVLKLHDHQSYLQACCQLLNSEWPRSERSRLITLNQSNDRFPMSLILIDSRLNQLLGHVKLRRERENQIFVESLIIDRMRRGHGLGSYLMRKVEEMIQTYGFKQINLTTTDKVKFYLKLGYVIVNSPNNYKPVNNLTSIKVVDDKIPKPPPLPVTFKYTNCSSSVKVLMRKELNLN